MAAFWLVKQEPSAYPFAQLRKDKKTTWEGVRNHEAKNHLQAMEKGDSVLYYHSGAEKAVVGVATVSKAAFPDPSSDDPRWVAVELRAVDALARAVTLAEIGAQPEFKDSALLRQSRLSVVPLSVVQYERILELAAR